MAEENSSQRVDPHQVAEIVSSYLRHHQVPIDQLTALIIEVHGALAGLGRAPPKQAPPRPAVPIRRSVQQDYVVCLECGFRAQTLRRHLRMAHGLTAADYRIRWQLPVDYPLVAPAYSDRRSLVAKALGLGRRRRSTTPPSRRRRPRRPSTP
jgi:predicted transcriptional regulator